MFRFVNLEDKLNYLGARIARKEIHQAMLIGRQQSINIQDERVAKYLTNSQKHFRKKSTLIKYTEQRCLN